MKVYYADKKLNEKYGKILKDKVALKECYNNVFHNFIEMRAYEKDIKIFFGWVQVFKDQDIYARHACFMLRDKIIDPTLFQRGGFEKIEGHKYIPMKIMTANEYVATIEIEIEKYSGLTGMQGALREVEMPIMKEMMEQGYVVSG